MPALGMPLLCPIVRPRPGLTLPSCVFLVGPTWDSPRCSATSYLLVTENREGRGSVDSGVFPLRMRRLPPGSRIPASRCCSPGSKPERMRTDLVSGISKLFLDFSHSLHSPS